MARPTVGANLNYSFGPFTESLVPVQPAPPSAPSVATVAAAHLTADIDYLQRPDAASRSAHITSIIAKHTQHHPLGFLGNSGPIGASMATDAVRRDLIEMLHVMNHEMSHSEKIAEDIATLQHQPTDQLLAAIPHILKAIYRDMVVQTREQLQHMNAEIQKGLWGSSTMSDTMMRDQFSRAITDLYRTADYIDQGNLHDAMSLYSTTMSNAASQLRVFQGAHAESERGKFVAQIGITVVAGFAAAYTGGLSMALMTGGSGALAGGTGIGLGTYAVSAGVSGSTFVLADRLLQKQVFDTPFLHKDNALDNTIDLGREVITTGALFGWMQGVSAAARTIPALTGELAPALNGIKNFGIEYAGLTTFNVATSDAPQQVFTRDYHQKSVAFLLGLKAGNASAALTFNTISAALPGATMFLRTEAGYFVSAMRGLSSELRTNMGDTIAMLRNMRGDPNTPILERVPLAAIIWGNMNLSFLFAKLVSVALRDYLPSDFIDQHSGFLQHLDSTILGKETPTLTAWKNTNLLFLGATTFFAGIDGFFPRPSTFRKTKLESLTRQFLVKLHDIVPAPYNDAPYYLLARINPSLPSYAMEWFLRGSIGANEMAGIRNPKVYAPVTAFKEALKSKPLERALKNHLGDFVPEKIVHGIARFPDMFLNFMGQVTPNKKGVLVGFGIDIAANSLLDIAGALVFSKNADFYKLLVPGFVISTFIGYANTRISQAQGIFSPSQKLLHRAKLGILKTAFYRGPYTSGITTSGFNFMIQLVYGVWAIAHANRITQPQPLRMHSPEVLERVQQARQRGSLTVATLDSGLGGLSVFANAYTQLQRGPFRKVTDIFLNAQSGPETGFNTQTTMADKARQLDHVLNQVTAQLQPDLVVLACHTMSLIYPHTEFAKKHGPHIPAVVDVMTASIELMVHGISSAPESQLVLMSTPAVAKSGVYQERLKARHVRGDRVFAEPSPDLAASIQNDPSGAATTALVDAHASRVRQMLSDAGRLADPVLIALNCSQYVFVAGMIQDAFARQGLNARIINPSYEMLNGLFEAPKAQPHTVSAEAHVFSEVPIGHQLGDFLAGISTTAAEAVKRWQPSNGMAIPQPAAQ